MGGEDEDVGMTCHELGRLLLKQGKVDESATLMQRAWEICEKRLEEGHLDLAKVAMTRRRSGG